MNNLLGIKDLTKLEVENLIIKAEEFKKNRLNSKDKNLENQTWALIFSKSSTRTRISFEVAINELGGSSIFLSNKETQLGRGESIEDTARVLNRMIHGLIIRTHKHEDILKFKEFSEIPVINALTDEEHPCQVLSDVLTIKEKLGSWESKKIVFLGDGNCNMARSWAWMAKVLNLNLVISSPKKFRLDDDFLNELGECPTVSLNSNVKESSKNADVLYTDTWISMGKEEEIKERLELLSKYQINDTLIEQANSKVMIQHCLPAYKGQEITNSVFEKYSNEIFQQAENRLHMQKAILSTINTNIYA